MKQNDRKPEEALLLNGVPYAEEAATPGAAEDRRRRLKWQAAAFVLGIAMLATRARTRRHLRCLRSDLQLDPERHR